MRLQTCLSLALRLLLFLLCLAAPLTLGWQQPPAGAQQPGIGTTVKVNVGLVQTDVMVFDRQGHFAIDLRAEQFDLQIDGKRRPVSFCELVSSGTGRDEAVWNANPAPARLPAPAPSGKSDSGRTLLFFLDDWHLSGESMVRSRAALSHLIDTAIGVSDRAGIFAASGSPGFLQQLTDNPAVLHAAVDKLGFFNPPVQDKGQPPMSEAQAHAIEQNDEAVLGYFVDAMSKGLLGNRPIQSRAAMEKIVRQRALVLASESIEIAGRTLSTLAQVMRVYASLPGRKVFFFLSDGFFLQSQLPETIGAIRRVTDTAARAGIVIYSLDTRGLIVGLPDASNPVRPDPTNRLTRSAASEVTAAQDALNALAVDTGGAFLKNTNALDAAMTKTLAETSRYYLLGWYLDPDMQEPGKYRSIRVSVRGRPDLKVRVRQAKVDLSLLAAQGRSGAVMAVPAATDAGAAMLQLLRSPLPIGVLAVSLQAGYDFLPAKGYCITIAMQTPIETAGAGAAKPEENGRLDLAGLISNTDGDTVGSFSESLSLPADPENQEAVGDREWIYSGVIPAKPGMYQVRVAVRDSRTGRSGTSLQWIDIPPFGPDAVSLCSIILKDEGTGRVEPGSPQPEMMSSAAVSIKRRFPKSARVSYFMRILNPGAAPLLVQIRLYRGNHVVYESGAAPPKEQESEDVTRPLLHGLLPLTDLTPGDHTLEILVKDSSSNVVTSQKIHFWIV